MRIDWGKVPVREELEEMKGAIAVGAAEIGKDSRKLGVAREQAKRSKQASDQAKMDWKRDVVAEGSPEYRAEVRRLRLDLARRKASFVAYPAQMASVVSPTERQKEVDHLNRLYTNYMFSACLGPLGQGVSAGSVLECLGVYMGCAVVSPEFRKKANMGALKALTPAVEGLARMNCSIENWAAEARNAAIGSLERSLHTKLPGHAKREAYTPKDYRDARSVRAVRNAYLAASNDGRLPLTPEGAAMTYLHFTAQAYEQMREPMADVAAITRSYSDAVDTLYKVAEKDGVPKEVLSANIRTEASKLAEAYPDFKRMFMELAYEDVSKADGSEIRDPSGRTVTVWRGEFKGKDGEPFLGPFTPRPPVTLEAMADKVDDWMHEAADPVAEEGGLRAMHDRMRQPDAWVRLRAFADMIDDDLPWIASEERRKADEGKPADERMTHAEAAHFAQSRAAYWRQAGRPMQAVSGAAARYGKWYTLTHEMSADDLAFMREHAPRQYDGSDIPDIEGSSDGIDLHL